MFVFQTRWQNNDFIVVENLKYYTNSERVLNFDEVVFSSLSFVADTVCVPVEEDIITQSLSQDW